MGPGNVKAIICTNDRSILQSLDQPTRLRSGQGIQVAILCLVNRLSNGGLQIQLCWTPSGSDIEQVRQAKELALGAQETGNLSLVLTQTVSATWRQVRRNLDDQAKREFNFL